MPIFTALNSKIFLKEQLKLNAYTKTKVNTLIKCSYAPKRCFFCCKERLFIAVYSKKGLLMARTAQNMPLVVQMGKNANEKLM